MTSALYFMALLTPPDIAEKITAWKEEMALKYGVRHALKSPPHITLQYPFRRPEKEEDAFIQQLQKFANSHETLTIRLSGFNCFPPRVIYVDVADPDSVTQRYHALHSYLEKNMKFSPGELNQRFHPHITIATRDLRKNMFHEAWSEFKDREYQTQYRSQELTLLKHNGRRWEVYSELSWGR